MRHQNTVFRDLLKLLPWTFFDALVENHGSDELARKFDTRHHFIALLYAQFSGAESLRAIETGMTSHQARLYHVGGKAPARSNFADANRMASSSFSRRHQRATLVIHKREAIPVTGYRYAINDAPIPCGNDYSVGTGPLCGAGDDKGEPSAAVLIECHFSAERP